MCYSNLYTNLYGIRRGGGAPQGIRASRCQPPPSRCVIRCPITLRCILCPTPLVHPLVVLLRWLVGYLSSCLCFWHLSCCCTHANTLIALASLHLCCYHHCTGIFDCPVASVTSVFAKESATTAKMPMQRGCWCRCNDGKDTSNRGNMMCPHQRPCCTGVGAIIALASLIAKESTKTATTPVQQGRWYRRNNGKDASNRGNSRDNNQLYDYFLNSYF